MFKGVFSLCFKTSNFWFMEMLSMVSPQEAYKLKICVIIFISWISFWDQMNSIFPKQSLQNKITKNAILLMEMMSTVGMRCWLSCDLLGGDHMIVDYQIWLGLNCLALEEGF